MKPEQSFNLSLRHLEAVETEAHVFHAWLDQPEPRLAHFETILSADERGRANRFLFARDRNRFLAARGMLREILGQLLRADPAQLDLVYGQYGKPRLGPRWGIASQVLHFNVAHSGPVAVYIVSAHGDVGIDVERIRVVREADSILSRYFSRRDHAEWHSAPTTRRNRMFFEIWTSHEALMKAVGGHLGELLRQIEVSPCDVGTNRLQGSVKTASGFSRFFLHRLTPFDGYLATAATATELAPVCWRWPPQ